MTDQIQARFEELMEETPEQLVKRLLGFNPFAGYNVEEIRRFGKESAVHTIMRYQGFRVPGEV